MKHQLSPSGQQITKPPPPGAFQNKSIFSIVGVGSSLLIHLILYIILNQFELPRVYQNSIKPFVDIDFQTEPHSKKSLVRQTQVPDNQIDKGKIKPKMLRLSELDQRVLIETRALKNGLSQNRSAESKLFPPQKESPDSGEALYPKNEAKIDSLSPGISTVGEELPDELAIGAITSLNTERYVHYAFFSRAEELIRFRWIERVRSAIHSLSLMNNNRLLFGKSWTTHLKIYLKPSGEFVKAIVKKESGINKFDLSAISAFKEARVFPNPPQELVDPEDGMIKLDYSFKVNLTNSALAEE